VFLSAPAGVRLERVKSYFYCDDKRAHQIIEQSDRDREGFHQYFFETKWTDPENYQLMLNTGSLHPQLCAELIKTALEKTFNKEIEISNTLRIKDLILGNHVVHHILYAKKIPVHFLEATVDAGIVTLFGVANSLFVAEMAIQAAKEIPEASSVSSEIQILQEYSVGR